MPKAWVKSVDTPDEKRDFPLGRLDLVKVSDLVFGRATFEPGWRWSNSVKPIAGTDLCMNHHNGYIVSGHMDVRMSDGTVHELGPGDVFVAEPGHDAWVVGDERCIALDFAPGIAGYALPG